MNQRAYPAERSSLPHEGTTATTTAATAGGGGGARPEHFQQALPVPAQKIGWVVGRKGSYINQLCQKSGATVTISDSESTEYGIRWKYVMIYGTGREVDRAKKLLHIRLDRYAASSDATAAAAAETEDGETSPATAASAATIAAAITNGESSAGSSSLHMQQSVTSDSTAATAAGKKKDSR